MPRAAGWLAHRAATVGRPGRQQTDLVSAFPWGKNWGRRLAHERPIQIDRALGNCSRRHKRARATGPHFSDLATCPDAMGEGGSGGGPGGERGELSVEACAEPSWPRSRPGCRAARDSLRTPGASTAPPDDSFMQDRMPLRGRDPGAEVGERVAVRAVAGGRACPLDQGMLPAEQQLPEQRLLALCSLPRTNPGNRVRYVRRNGPYTLARSQALSAETASSVRQGSSSGFPQTGRRK